MTLVEIVVVIGILVLIMIAVSSFQVNILKNTKSSQDSLSNLEDAKTILRTMVNELRIASQSDNGDYPIVEASTSTLIFFSDIDHDGSQEQVKYFISDNDLKKDIIKSTNETVLTLSNNITNDAHTLVFEYFDSIYDGSGSSLVQPVAPTNVSLIKINLMISKLYTAQVSLRNINDNI